MNTDRWYYRVFQSAHDLIRSLLPGSAAYVTIWVNGGSAANTMHLANDLHYGIGACGPEPSLPGLRVEVCLWL